MKKTEKEFFASLKKENIRKEIIEVFKKTGQNDFFDQIFSGYFYSSEPIPIGNGEKADVSTILAKMISYLPIDKNSRILEIGTGSGYSTAILARLFSEIVTVEYYEDLALSAKEKLTKLNLTNIRFLCGDITDKEGISGFFDGIIIFAACESRPLFLLPHLKENGVMVFPMGPIYQQQVTVLKNEPGDKESMYKMSFHELCVFTPLIGMY